MNSPAPYNICRGGIYGSKYKAVITDTFTWKCNTCDKEKQVRDTEKNRSKRFCNLSCGAKGKEYKGRVQHTRGKYKTRGLPTHNKIYELVMWKCKYCKETKQVTNTKFHMNKQFCNNLCSSKFRGDNSNLAKGRQKLQELRLK